MKSSTKRLIVLSFGIVLFVGFIVVTDINIVKIELHNIFMLSIIAFFTAVNFVQYVKEKRKEEIESR